MNLIRKGTYLLGASFILLVSCQNQTYEDVQISGAMRNVMWKGELAGTILMDTLIPKKGLYGLGPESYLRGEILLQDGKVYVSRIQPDSSMIVEESKEVSAPFFVFTRVKEWKKTEIPAEVRSIKDLEHFIDQQSAEAKRPFAFQIKGRVAKAKIHVQNLPPGSKVSSPAEAHQGQVDFELNNQQVEIVGFFSTEHQGVFTHHDSFLHMHLITTDQQMMGHLDEIELEEGTLFLPRY